MMRYSSMVKTNYSIEKHLFIHAETVMELDCEVEVNEGRILYHRIIGPNGHKYTPKFKEGARIYITYQNKKWFMSSS